MKMRKTFSLILASVMLLTSLFTVGFAELSDEAQNYLNEAITYVDPESGVFTTSDASLRNLFTTNAEEQAANTNSISTTAGTLYIKKGYTEESVTTAVTRSINNKKTNQSLTNVGDGLGIEANTEAAAAMLSGFVPYISMLLGVMVTLITIFMTVFSAFDIAYIAFPVFRNKCEDAKVNGGGLAKTKSNGETSLRFVTDDAQYAVQQGTVENGKSPWAIYFKKRVLSYILLAIILFILMTGNITLITNIAVKVVAGIMDVLGSLAI